MNAVVPDACASTVPAVRKPQTEVAASPAARGAIEVTLPSGAVVRVDGAVDAKALRTVLGALVPR